MPLWVTEGIKKGDALTSRGLYAITLSGVWNWKSQGDPLPDWDHVVLRGRTVYIAFDADAAANYQVAQAMHDLGYFLKGEGADVRYVVCPGDPNDKTGVDDFLAAGGTVEDLIAVATTEAPKVKKVTAALPETDVYPLLAGTSTDATSGQGPRLAPLEGRHAGRGCSDHHVREAAARWVSSMWGRPWKWPRRLTAEALDLARKWLGYNSKSKIDNVLALAKGVLEIRVDDSTRPQCSTSQRHGGPPREGAAAAQPAELHHQGDRARYVPGATNDDWLDALEALPESSGTPATGSARRSRATSRRRHHPVPARRRRQRKSTIMNAVSRALGDYYLVVAPRRSCRRQGALHRPGGLPWGVGSPCWRSCPNGTWTSSAQDADRRRR